MENVKIISTDHLGRGIARVNNKVIFVNDTVEGDIVDIEIIKDNKKYSEANVIKYRSKSSLHVYYPCKYSNKCGGCNIYFLDYQKQLEFKVEKVKNIFKKYLDICINPQIEYSNNLS